MKDRWNLDNAKDWLFDHDFIDQGVDTTKNTYRFRQLTPNFKRYRVKKTPIGIMFVFGYNPK